MSVEFSSWTSTRGSRSAAPRTLGPRPGLGQCRRREDQGVERSGAAALARRHAARAHPLPDLPQGRRGEHVDPRLRTARQWVTLSEAELVKELQELEGERPSPAQDRQARRLFARAVETPGGLKIETIHAFASGCCTSSR